LKLRIDFPLDVGTGKQIPDATKESQWRFLDSVINT
jgi:hypothetical protein